MLKLATDSIDRPIVIAALATSDLLFILLPEMLLITSAVSFVNNVFSFFMSAPCWYVYIMGMHGYVCNIILIPNWNQNLFLITLFSTGNKKEALGLFGLFADAIICSFLYPFNSFSNGLTSAINYINTARSKPEFTFRISKACFYISAK